MTCTDMVCTIGQMEESLRDNTRMIKKKGLVYITGLMVENMRAGGAKESNMV